MVVLTHRVQDRHTIGILFHQQAKTPVDSPADRLQLALVDAETGLVRQRIAAQLIVHQQSGDRLALLVEQRHGRRRRLQLSLVGDSNRFLHLLIERQQLANLVRIEG
ncbi:hypothetical protein D3C76_1402210 [compost metagenome]